MTSSWLLNQSFFGAGGTLDWLPPLHIARPTIFGSIAVDTETRFYYLCVAGPRSRVRDRAVDCVAAEPAG